MDDASSSSSSSSSSFDKSKTKSAKCGDKGKSGDDDGKEKTLVFKDGNYENNEKMEASEV